MKIYIIGIIFGVIFLFIQRRISEKRNDVWYHSGNVCYNKIEVKSYCKTSAKKSSKNIIKLFILIVFASLVILAIKYDFIGKIKPIARNVIDVLKPIMIKLLSFAKQAFLFILGLCTPYLSKIATKKLKKLRKKLKKIKKKMKNRKVNNTVLDEDKEEK